jgi:hypothetical protein
MMGEIAKVEVTPIAGVTDPNKPMVVENGAEPGSTWTALGKVSNSFYRSAPAARVKDLHRKGGGEK